jgi:hypothetical protein
VTPGPNPQVDLKMLEETRRQINRLIDEVARLSESELGPNEYFGELLKRVLAAMAAPAGAVWVRTSQGNLALQFQINLREVGLDRSEEARQQHDALLRQAVSQPEPLHRLPHSGAGAAVAGDIAPGNPTDYLLLLVPILLNNEVKGFIEVWQSPDRPLNAVPGFLQFMSSMADLAARYLRNQLMGQMVGQQQIWTQLEVFARQVHGSLSPRDVAYQVANEGRRLVDCDRVSVAIRHGRKCKIEAVSGTDVVEKRSNLVRLMRKLCDAVVRWGERLVYTGTKDDSLPPAVLKALDNYLHESNSKLLVCLPLKDEREAESKKPARSAVLMESFEPAAEPQQLVARLEVVARHAAPALYNAIEYKRIPMRFLWVPMAKVQEGLGGKAKAIGILLLLALVGLISALVLIQAPLKMDAKGQLLPVTRRYVYAPSPGGQVVRIVDVNPGDVIEENQNLLQLYNRDVAKNLREFNLRITAAQESIDQLDKEARGDSKPAEKARALIDKAEKLRDLRVASMERDLLLKDIGSQDAETGYFFVRAPAFTREENQQRDRFRQDNGLDPVGRGRWTILSHDFRETVAGRNVDPSLPLMRIGDKDGGFEVELKIPQQNLYKVMDAFRHLETDVLEVDLLVRSEPTRTFKGRLHKDRIGGEATPQRDGFEAEPVVVAYVSIDDPDIVPGDRIPLDLLVTGTEVVAKVRCGKAALGYTLFYGVWEFICEKVLFSF